MNPLQHFEQLRNWLLESTLATPETEKLEVLSGLTSWPATPQVARLLAEIVATVPQALLRTRALEALHKLEFNQTTVNEISEVWWTTRDPDLTDLLIKKQWTANNPLALRVLTALQVYALEIFKGSGPEILEPLTFAATDPNPVIVERVGLVVSCYLERPDVLNQIWQDERYSRLASAIVRRRWQYTNPVGEQVLARLVENDLLALIDGETLEFVRPLAHACEYKGSRLADRAIEVLSRFKSTAVQAEICRVAMESGDTDLTRIALATGYRFPQPHEQTLFYFLTRQWSRYEGLDFDGRLVLFAYEVVSEKLRRRIIEVARAAGRLEFVELVVGKGRLSPDYSEISDDDWLVIVEILKNGQNWPRMWDLALTVPPRRSLTLLRFFRKTGWLPAEPEAQAIFRRLCGQARSCQVDDSELSRLVQIEERLNRYNSAGVSLALVPLGTKLPQQSHFQAASVASQLVAIGQRPLAANTLSDFMLIHQALEDQTLQEVERRWLQLMELLVGWNWRHEIEIEESLFSNPIQSDFDIEV